MERRETRELMRRTNQEEPLVPSSDALTKRGKRIIEQTREDSLEIQAMAHKRRSANHYLTNLADEGEAMTYDTLRHMDRPVDPEMSELGQDLMNEWHEAIATTYANAMRDGYRGTARAINEISVRSVTPPEDLKNSSGFWRR